MGNGENAWYWTEKIYQRLYTYHPEAYYELARRFDYHVDLVEDLMLELTRAANLVSDQVRRHISSSFRLEEGAALVMSGPHMDFSFRISRAEYVGTQEEERRYPGLRRFMEIRKERDSHFGEGVSEDYFSPFEQD